MFFRGITREQWNEARDKRISRMASRLGSDRQSNRLDSYKQMRDFFATVPYEYQGDGLDDYNKFQRPSSDGKGYVAVCPGEPDNNVYVDEPHLVRMLTRKYNEYMQQRNG